ncbi:MAG: hypothetical protein LLG02_14775, partial [Pelosinus sp.]|nr:hypothetical protein [Pelosinus sp.]
MASNGMMSQAEIEALMASMNAGQEEKEPEVQPAETAAAPQSTMSQDAASVKMQSEIASPPEEAAAVGGPMSQKEIEAFLAAINTPPQEMSAVSSTVAPSSHSNESQEDVAAKEPAAEVPAAEPADPNKTMTPEEIEAMLAAMNAGEEAAKEPEAEVPAEAPDDPNKTMTPEEIE